MTWYFFINSVFFLNKIKEESSGSWWLKYVDDFLIESRVCIWYKFESEILWQFVSHLSLEFEISIFLLSMEALKMCSDLFFDMKRDLKIVHVLIHDKKFHSFFICVSSCPYDNFNDLIDNITVDSKPKNHTKKHVSYFSGISALNVSIWNVSNGVDSPIKWVEILPSPWQFYNRRISSWVENPADFMVIKTLHVGSNIPLI